MDEACRRIPANGGHGKAHSADSSVRWQLGFGLETPEGDRCSLIRLAVTVVRRGSPVPDPAWGGPSLGPSGGSVHAVGGGYRTA